jgi:hypothetical protein
LQLVAGAIAVHVAPLLAVIKYEVIGFPPSSDGGDQDTTVEVSPARTASDVGAVGADAGVALADVVENADCPIVFSAATVNEYEPPFVSPFITTGDEVAVNVSPVGETFTMYPEIAAPFAPAPLKVIVALLSPETAVTIVGAVGSPAGVTEFEVADWELPTAFCATAVNV